MWQIILTKGKNGPRNKAIIIAAQWKAAQRG